MKALVLAGGRGTRLRPYTTVIPKPLMPVGSRPILEILILQLRAAGVVEVILAVGYLGDLIRAYFGDGSRLGIRISYVDEKDPLGTAGPIGLAVKRLGPDFLMMNGDLLTTMDFGRLISHHKESKAAATIGTYKREVKIDFGVVDSSEDGSLVGYTEKPTLPYTVSMGVYMLKRNAIRDRVLPVHRLDAPDLMRELLLAKRKVSCFRADCYWLDIGRPEDYVLANELLDSGKLKLPVPEPA